MVRVLKNNSAVFILDASGILYTSLNLNKAEISGSCGWAVSGSLKKTIKSISPFATLAPIIWSPPSGPDLTYDYIGGVTVGEENRKLTDSEMQAFTHDEKIMMCIDEKLGESAGDYDSTEDYEYERDDY